MRSWRVVNRVPIDGENVVEGKNTVEGGHAAGKRHDGCERSGRAPAARLCAAYCSNRLTPPTRLQRAEDLTVVKITEGCGWGGGAHHAVRMRPEHVKLRNVVVCMQRVAL